MTFSCSPPPTSITTKISLRLLEKTILPSKKSWHWILPAFMKFAARKKSPCAVSAQPWLCSPHCDMPEFQEPTSCDTQRPPTIPVTPEKSSATRASFFPRPQTTTVSQKKRLLQEPLFSTLKQLAVFGVNADGRRLHCFHCFHHLSFFLRHSTLLPTAQTRAPRLQ